jgi:glutamine amidotransferase
MCRLLGYLGPPVTLQSLLYDPPHSLYEQAWAPRQQHAGFVNVDGVGVGWYVPDVRSEPARYRAARPMWADHSLASFAGVVTSPAVVAVVRSATPPSPSEESSTPPFTDGHWLFAHNGKVEGFHAGAGTRLRRSVSERRDAGIVGTSDSEVLFALFLDRIDEGLDMAEAVTAVLAAVEAEAGGTLTMVVTDGRRMAATVAGNTLAALPRIDAVVLASEPYDDDPGWQPIADRTLVETTATSLTCTPLPGRPPT